MEEEIVSYLLVVSAAQLGYAAWCFREGDLLAAAHLGVVGTLAMGLGVHILRATGRDRL